MAAKKNRKLAIKTLNEPALIINRSAIKEDSLVYIAVANKKIKYEYGDSKIVYIGTTKNGASRIAASAAAKANDLLSIHGVSKLEMFVVYCSGQDGVKTWTKLERGLLLSFREVYGAVPLGNTHGVKMKWTDEQEYFTLQKLRSIIEEYST